MFDARILSAARSLESLAPAVSRFDDIATVLADLERATKRGYLLPDEDERLRTRFGHYLLARAELLDTIQNLKPLAVTPENRELQFQAFLVSYTAACCLVRAGRFLARNFSANPIIRRKLDEAEPRFGITRRQFTRVYKSLMSPRNVIGIYRASQFALVNSRELEATGAQAPFQQVYQLMREADEAVRLSVSDYLKARWYYRLYALRRRETDSIQRSMFLLFEMSGRMISEMRYRWRSRQVSPQVIEQIRELLKPGDILVTRHKYAASNLFLPGFWPHVGLYAGGPQGDVLEARKDGVLFRPLSDTLAVDFVAVLRPGLSTEEISQALTRAASHAGKLYDFTFDFSRSDRLVCTEVVYRGFDGIGGLNFKLTERAGRFTLSAGDLMRRALEKRGLTLLALYGTPDCHGRLLTGEAAQQAARRSISD